MRRFSIVALVAATFTAPPVSAENNAGAYLAGRVAIANSDFSAASQYYTRALSRDPGNPGLLENAALAQLALGQLDRGVAIAEVMEANGLRSQVAHMTMVAHLVNEGDYAALLARDPETQGIGPLVDGLISAWSHFGAGSVQQGLDEFDLVAEQNGLRGFALFHKAMALAMVGDFEGAEAIYSDPQAGPSMMTRRGAVARAEILSQLGRNEDALELLADAFGSVFDPGLTVVADRLAAGEQLPFTHIRSVADGMSEVFFTISAALSGEAADDYALIYGRVAEYLRPDHVDAILLVAQLLEDLGQYDLAVAAYKNIPSDSPDFSAAELGRAEVLRRNAKPDAAIEVLEQLAEDYPSLPAIFSALGDIHRQQEDYSDAIAAYDKALGYTEPGDRTEWFLHYARGISYERQDNWPAAESDFRAALELNPDQPQVLNYLGYSLVEKQINLDEALDMIQRAVAARPDSGYIVDSLGWVLYRLGRYEQAVEHMEKAVALMPVDPVVNDHLGDVYWAVGRYREAEFQWKRALSFIDPTDTGGEADPDRIRRKLEVGLDQVLVEEGALPLEVANDDG
ncbi:MAG: tetratricopeptide repeat protein [Pseudomonadota bacterium]